MLQARIKSKVANNRGLIPHNADLLSRVNTWLIEFDGDVHVNFSIKKHSLFDLDTAESD